MYWVCRLVFFLLWILSVKGQSCNGDWDCYGGGTCTENVCHCSNGYSSETNCLDYECDNERASCQNGGVCINGKCNCTKEWTGSACERESVQVRLNGERPYLGYLEVQINGKWGTVCHEKWDHVDAEVVCKQLGYLGAITATSSGLLGEASNDVSILMSNVVCLGRETNLGGCQYDTGGSITGCTHSKDAGVICRDPAIEMCRGLLCLNDGTCYLGKCYCLDSFSGDYCEQYTGNPIRLSEGNILNEGRVDMLYNEEWLSVCTENWNLYSADVACKQLGYPGAARTSNEPRQSGISDSLLLSIKCDGSEDYLSNCSEYSLLGFARECPFNHEVWISCVDNCDTFECYNGGTCFRGHCYCQQDYVGEHCEMVKEFQARLLGGNIPAEGTIEIYNLGKWRAVCNDRWSEDNANVICRQLGFPKAYYSLNFEYGGSFGFSRSFWLDSVVCNGSELTLADCVHGGWNNPDSSCTPQESVGVVCAISNELAPICTEATPCENGGTCFMSACLCDVGYTGYYCNEYKCNLGCMNNGSCVGPNTCNCSNDKNTYYPPYCGTSIRTSKLPPQFPLDRVAGSLIGVVLLLIPFTIGCIIFCCNHKSSCCSRSTKKKKETDSKPLEIFNLAEAEYVVKKQTSFTNEGAIEEIESADSTE